MHEGNKGAIHNMDTYMACMEATYGTHMEHTHMAKALGQFWWEGGLSPHSWKLKSTKDKPRRAPKEVLRDLASPSLYSLSSLSLFTFWGKRGPPLSLAWLEAKSKWPSALKAPPFQLLHVEKSLVHHLRPMMVNLTPPLRPFVLCSHRLRIPQFLLHMLYKFKLYPMLSLHSNISYPTPP